MRYGGLGAESEQSGQPALLERHGERRMTEHLSVTALPRAGSEPQVDLAIRQASGPGLRSRDGSELATENSVERSVVHASRCVRRPRPNGKIEVKSLLTSWGRRCGGGEGGDLGSEGP